MRNILKFVLITIISIFIILFAFISWFIYNTNYKVKTISEYTNTANSYSVLFQSVGEPSFPFGCAKVKTTVFNDKHKKIKIYTDCISNDGGPATSSDIMVNWLPTEVKITLSGSEAKDQIHILKYI